MALDCTLVDIDSIFHTSVQGTYFYQMIFGTKSKFSENQNTLKGQLISKANCQAKDSSKKRTNEFVFTSMQPVFVRFLEESSARKNVSRLSDL